MVVTTSPRPFQGCKPRDNVLTPPKFTSAQCSETHPLLAAPEAHALEEMSLLPPAWCFRQWPSWSQTGASTAAHVDTAGFSATALHCMGLPGSIFHPGAMETHAFPMSTRESCSLAEGARYRTGASCSAEKTKQVSG